MIDTFAAIGSVNFDTARIYASGKSEEMTGRVMTAQGSHDKFKIATKASPSQENGLSPAGIRAQLALSLEALQTTKISVLFVTPSTVPQPTYPTHCSFGAFVV